MPSLLSQLKPAGQPQGGSLLSRMQPEQPQDPGFGNLSDLGRGVIHSVKQTAGMVKDLPGGFMDNLRNKPGEIMEALPGAIEKLKSPIETGRSFLSGAREVLPEIGQAFKEDIAGTDQMPTLERVGRVGGFIGEGLLTGGAIKVVKGARAARVAQGGKNVLKGFQGRPVAGLLPESTPSTIAARRAADVTQEAADRAAGLRFGAQAVPEGRLVAHKRAGSPIEQAIQEGLEEASQPTHIPKRVTMEPPPFGNAPSPAQPRVTVGKAPKKKADIVLSPIGKAPKPVSALEEASKVLQAPTPVEVAPNLTHFLSSYSVSERASDLRRLHGAERAAEIMRLSRGDIQNLAPGPSRLPLEAEMRFLDNQYKVATQGLAIPPGPGQRPAYSLENFLTAGSRTGRRPAEVAKDITTRMKSDAGFASRTTLATMGGAAGGAGVGALIADDPDAAMGLALLLGGLGAFGAPKFLNFVAHHPQSARKMAKDTAEIATMLRSEALLSGMALPKNIQAAIGSPIQAAFLTRSAKPIKEALRVPTNIKNAIRGFKMKDFETGSRSRRAGPFGRAISAVDFQAQEALKRAGLSQAESDFLLLKRPLTDFLKTKYRDVLQSPMNRAISPFQRTAQNVQGSGREILAGMTPEGVFTPSRLKQLKYLNMAFGAGAGAVVSQAIDDPWGQMATLALMSALVGPMALPFGIGGAAVGVPAALAGTNALDTEFSADPRKALQGIAEPSGVRLAGRFRTDRKRRRRRRRR